MPTHLLMTSTWTIQSQNNAYAGRLHDQAFLAMASATAVRDGVLVAHTATGTTPTDLKVTQSTPTASRTLNVAAGACVVTRSGQTVYTNVLAAAGTVQIDVADTTNPRIDLVIVRLYDQATNGSDSQTRARIEVVPGVAAASPVAPYSSIPAGVGYIPLAEIAVAANAVPANTAIVDANITDKRKAASVRGGIRRLLPGDSASDAGAYDGEYTDNGGTLRRWSSASSAWQTMATAGSLPYVYGELLRSDGVAQLNNTSQSAGMSDLKVYNPVSVGASWGTTYLGRGISLASSGLYRVHLNLYTNLSGGGTRYGTVELVHTDPAITRIVGVDVSTNGYGAAIGSTIVRVPSGKTLGLVFRAFSDRAANVALNPNDTSHVIVTRIGEA